MRTPIGARKYNQQITLCKQEMSVDSFGHPTVGKPQPLLSLMASVKQMSAQKTMLTFQQANVVGLDIEFRNPFIEFNCILWNGREVYFSTPDVDEANKLIHISGHYQEDNPFIK